MRSRRLLAALAATALAALVPAAPPAGAGSVPTRIGVRGFEYSLVLSRNPVRPGFAIVQFRNQGEDPHDLKLQRVGGAAVHSIGELPSGGVATFPQMWLKRASTYRLWCSLENHALYGMETTLRVRRRR
jgi:hypothetical protein